MYMVIEKDKLFLSYETAVLGVLFIWTIIIRLYN